MSNRLENEKSPYLRQHKDNPVDWYPWGEAAFQKAVSEDKPVFLSIGYSTCHWCHVMAHESFENEEVAKLLEDFVCIKVDREERPDIDAVYMAVCQAVTGSGGWPLTIFMTPQQKPFFAGTYFPRESKYGQPGLIGIIRQITEFWKTDREALKRSGEEIADAVRQELERSTDENGFGQEYRKILENACGQLWKSFDYEWGGFGMAPKFPAAHKMLFLMRMYEEEKIPEALLMVKSTLTAMACGGIFDHIGGGFSRYSTDEKWLVPHFEKMLYDNALLIMAYLEAFQISKDPFYAGIARRSADYILEELRSPEGGFYCGQDADSDGVEGKYYVFDRDEVMGVLGKERGKKFCDIYDITEQGNFEGKSIPNRINSAGKFSDTDANCLKILREYRKKRAELHLDNKILLSWNAWTVIALARAGSILGEERYAKAAVKAQRFISDKMTDGENRLFLRYCDKEAANRGQLDDYAVYAMALLELYRATFDIRYLEEAVLRAEQMLELFEDKKNGGFFINAHDAEMLISRPKEVYDGALPSGNSVAQTVLEKLALLTGEDRFGEAADRQHRFMASGAKDFPTAHCFALTAMASALFPQKELICTGSDIPEALKDYMRENPAHDLNILLKSPGNADRVSQAAPYTEAYPVSSDTLLYLCENGTCHAPVRDFEDIRKFF